MPFFRELPYFLGLKAFKQRTSQRGWATPPTQNFKVKAPEATWVSSGMFY